MLTSALRPVRALIVGAVIALMVGLLGPTGTAVAAGSVSLNASVTGTPVVGQTLTAVATAVTPGNADLTYKWQTTNPVTDIPSATSATFQLTSAQIGKHVQVAITGTASGKTPATATSTPTTTVQGVFSAAPVVVLDSQTPVVDEPITASFSGEAPTADSYTYQWYADGNAINGATNLIYTPTAAVAGKALVAKVTAIKADYVDKTGSSAATDAVAKADFTVLPTVTITGTPTVGETLTANASDEVPTSDAYEYQWLADGVEISGATESTYELSADEDGKAVSVAVTATKPGYNDADAVESDATSPVAKAGFTTNPTVTITGTEAVGETLTANASGEDPNGTGYTYQWYADGTLIAGATDSTYVVTGAQVGKVITVKVKATRAGYNDSAEVESAATGAIALADFTTAPGVTISGTETLTASASGEAPAGDSYSYQWYADDTLIAGATGSTYVLVGADAGKAITVKAKAVKAGYNDSDAGTSAATGAIAKADFTSGPSTVTINDTTPTVGQTLTASASGEAPAGDSYSYQWYLGSDAISGETAATYVVRAGDLGSTLTVKATAKKTGYNDSAEGESTATSAVSPGTLAGGAVALNTSGPKVGTVMKATPSGFSPTADSYTYQWYRSTSVGWSAISGATSQTYTVVDFDLNRKLKVKAFAVKAGYTSKSLYSSTTSRVNKITVSKTTVTHGHSLTVTAQKLRAGQTYRIYIGGKSVYKGTVGSTGKISKTVTVPSSTGAKTVRVSGYTKYGNRDFTVYTTITVK